MKDKLRKKETKKEKKRIAHIRQYFESEAASYSLFKIIFLGQPPFCPTCGAYKLCDYFQKRNERKPLCGRIDIKYTLKKEEKIKWKE